MTFNLSVSLSQITHWWIVLSEGMSDMSLYLQTNSFRFFVAMERQNFPYCNQVTPFAYGYLNPGKPWQDWLSYITPVQNHRRMKQKRYNYVLQEDLHTNSYRVNWLSHYSSFCDHLVFEKFTMEASSWKSKITQFQFFFPMKSFKTLKTFSKRGCWRLLLLLLNWIARI